MTRLLRFLPLLLVLAVLSAAFPLVLRHVSLRSDISDFLPDTRTPEAAFLLHELREGAATRLLIAGIEGAPAPDLARLSRTMATALDGSGLFAIVANGAPRIDDAEAALLFAHRYALSPTDLTEAALRDALETLLDGLRSSAEPLLRRFGFADPTGAFLALLRGWSAEARVATNHGVWMAAGPRALILAQTRASGLDTEAQQRAADAFRAAFAAADPPPGARLLLSGPGVFAAEAAAAVRADVKLVSSLSFLLVAAFLFWRYAAAVAGLVPMLASGFPGLAQLGLFAAAGLAGAALATRFLLPALLPAEGLPVRALPERAAHVLLRLPSLRWPVLGGLALVAIALALAGGPRLARDIAELSPVPEPVRALDGELRGQVGAPDVRVVLSVTGADAEAALRASEAAAAALLRSGAVAGIDQPARYLPSIATQRDRIAALPDDATLAARLEAARAGLPFRATAFAPFLDGVAEARRLPPLTPADLREAPLLAARLSPLLRQEADGWRALLLPEGIRDLAALRAAAATIPGLLVVEIKAETEALLDQGITAALRWGAVGGVLVLLLLGAGRGVAGGLRIALALCGALLLTFAALHALGERITVFHLTAALLLAGVGMDYALFISRTDRGDAGDAARALGAVITCMVTTLLTFGLLALCRTPVLHATGLTVCIGVASAFLLACALAPRRSVA